MARALRDYGEDELLDLIRGSEHTTYFVADWQAELDRRANERHNLALTRIAQRATAAAVVSAVAAGVALIALLIRG
jgi:hypothetical protein